MTFAKRGLSGCVRGMESLGTEVQIGSDAMPQGESRSPREASGPTPLNSKNKAAGHRKDKWEERALERAETLAN